MNRIYNIENLDCPTCALKIQNMINTLDGIKSADVNFFTQKVSIDSSEEISKETLKKINKMCRRVDRNCKIVD